MENLLVNKVAAVKEVRQAAEYQKKKQACILTGLAGSSRPVFFAAADKLLGGDGSMPLLLLRVRKSVPIAASLTICTRIYLCRSFIL